jgi:hypothetical protein
MSTPYHLQRWHVIWQMNQILYRLVYVNRYNPFGFQVRSALVLTILSGTTKSESFLSMSPENSYKLRGL